MNNKDVHKIVNGIKANLFKNSNSFSIGMLKSHFKGSGLKFKEHQIYNHGDDVKFIDWKMLAKTSVPYVKTFEEERNVEISILLDCSQGMLMGVDGKSKFEVAIEITSLIYLLSGMTKDYVQVALCDGSRITRIPKKNGELGVVALINTLKRIGLFSDNGKLDLNYYKNISLNENYERDLIKEFYRKKELVILSDFYDFLSIEKLKSLVLRKHVHAFRLITPLDDANEFRYSFKTSSYENNKAKTINAHLVRNESKVPELGINVKNLDIASRYLESFVKEML